jgi:hypothetical protein
LGDSFWRWSNILQEFKLPIEERSPLSYHQKHLDRDCVAILGIKGKYLEKKDALFQLAHESCWTLGAKSLLTNGLDELYSAADVMNPDEEEDISEMKGIYLVPLAYLHLTILFLILFYPTVVALRRL